MNYFQNTFNLHCFQTECSIQIDKFISLPILVPEIQREINQDTLNCFDFSDINIHVINMDWFRAKWFWMRIFTRQFNFKKGGRSTITRRGYIMNCSDISDYCFCFTTIEMTRNKQTRRKVSVSWYVTIVLFHDVYVWIQINDHFSFFHYFRKRPRNPQSPLQRPWQKRRWVFHGVAGLFCFMMFMYGSK